jgi:tol-pal system protein YbgF
MHYSQKASEDVISLREELISHVRMQEQEMSYLQEDIRTIKTLLGVKVDSPRKDMPSKPSLKNADSLTTSVTPSANLAKVTGVPDPEELYSSAYAALSQGELKDARKKFEEFLTLFPDTEYSDNAQFWIGESYYREKKYEEAILEFEEVIKKYPRGNKLPDAMLKQAFSFLAINDTNSAKLLLQKTIDKYPTSAQAEIAKAKLKSVK